MTYMTDDTLFQSVRRVWNGGEQLRAMRRRLKRFTYGQQWDDLVPAPSGEMVSERELLRQLGRKPMTHNLLRSLVKTVVGRFRHQVADEALDEIARVNLLPEIDARTLEEFLISGCAIQRVVYERRTSGLGVWVDPVSPARFFCNRFLDPRGDDLQLLGMLHDMSLTQVLMRHGHGAARRMQQIREAYSRCSSAGYALPDGTSPLGLRRDGEAFGRAADPTRCRVIEVWTLEAAMGRGACRHVWHCRWFAPDGTVIDETDSPYAHGSHPFAFKFYPLIDGEVHPFIEDVVDIQYYINRLITLVDGVMNASAKGVLLFPTDAVPPGYDLREVLQQWNRPGGVIPVNPTALRMPEQVNTNASNSVASSLLETELKLIQQISGVSGALQGQTMAGNTNSATLYESQVSNSAIALLDIFETFNSFRESRDKKIAGTL